MVLFFQKTTVHLSRRLLLMRNFLTFAANRPVCGHTQFSGAYLFYYLTFFDTTQFDRMILLRFFLFITNNKKMKKYIAISSDQLVIGVIVCMISALLFGLVGLMHANQIRQLKAYDQILTGRIDSAIDIRREIKIRPLCDTCEFNSGFRVTVDSATGDSKVEMVPLKTNL